MNRKLFHKKHRYNDKCVLREGSGVGQTFGQVKNTNHPNDYAVFTTTLILFSCFKKNTINEVL